MWLAIASILIFAARTLGQFPPQPEGVTTLNSNRTAGVSISYKETHFCETTPGVKSYSGHVHLPVSVLGLEYNISTFFWYFEARNKPRNAPFIIYLAGGVGESSMFGATMMGGPCYINDDANSTFLNPWSFNNEANVLYIDQPVQTGFSYDVLVNGTLDQMQQPSGYVPTDFSMGITQTNATFLVGTFPSQLENQTSNSSVQAAHALYHFTQAFVNEFPRHNTNNTKINLWANSWGGFYCPSTLAYFEQQNELLECNSSSHEKYSILNIDTLGLLNGCIDTLVEQPLYPLYLYNNTYMPLITDEDYTSRMDAFTTPGGCRDMISQCRGNATLLDPQYIGNNSLVNDICGPAFATCFQLVQGGGDIPDPSNANPDRYTDATLPSRSAFDIGHFMPEAYPYTYISSFFNREWVQAALGVPLNFSAFSSAVLNYPGGAFANTSDAVRGNKSNIEYLLSRGKKVVLVYGDRDYRCNWLGAEAVSLSLEFPGQDRFRESGYEEVRTNGSYVGGVAREAGNLAFVRVFDAGHYPHASQPETVYRVLERSLRGLDVSRGEEKVWIGKAGGYSTKGPGDAWGWRNTMPESPVGVCSTWFVDLTCSEEQILALKNGSAVLRGDVAVKPAGTVW